MKNAISEDGSLVVVGVDDIEYNTLSNGKVVAKTIPGQLAQVPVDEDDTYLRTNYDESDNINFRDGDKKSKRNFGDQETDDPMYDSPQHEVNNNEDGTLDKKFDSSSSRTTLVNNEVRVYKGASWKDREYW